MELPDMSGHLHRLGVPSFSISCGKIFFAAGFFTASFLVLLLPFPSVASSSDAGEYGYDRVVAVVDGEIITFGQVESRLGGAYRIYEALSGMSEEEIEEKKLAARRQALENMIQELVLANKLRDEAITLSDEMEAKANAEYERRLSSISAFVLKEYPSLSGAELDGMVDSLLASGGATRETLRNNVRQAVLRETLFESARMKVTGASGRETEEFYEALVREQTEMFDSDASQYEKALLEDRPVVYRPETCRVIKQVYIKFDDDIAGLIRQLMSHDSAAEAEAMRADQHERQRAAADDILKRLKGEPFENIMEEIKPGSRDEKNYISHRSNRFSKEYKEAAMGIDAEGGVSAPIRTDFGTVILYWADTLEAEGRIPIERVYGVMESLAIEKKRDEALKETMREWRSRANVVIYPDNLRRGPL
jgi:parvulin-like peptidyl-prolyl isomerase